MSTPPEKQTTVSDIAAFIEEWAPPASAQSYDNVGLQIGRPDRPVRSVLVALDLTPAVVDEARSGGIDLILTHHPLIFRPLRSLTPASLSSALALRLAESGIALYSAHTNLDASRDGVSFALARALGLENVAFLQPMTETLFKLVTFVPATHADAVRIALAAAGAGRIGEYDACAFASEGTGFFHASANAKPFIGTAGGDVERAEEIRLEVEIARWDLARTVSALESAHPYEQVAYDVYPVAQPSTRYGMGAIGTLPAPVNLNAFLDLVCTSLGAEAIRYVADPDAVVSRVAVCGGSGGDLIGAARRARADALVTADVSYHRFFDTMGDDGAIGMAVVDAGHYETEAMTEALLVDRLAARFPGVTFQRTRHRTGPIRWHARGRTM
ncbi:MAG TPA: Nif3-like dinuclear metal center hexameric protein [Rhodothermales bacterium]